MKEIPKKQILINYLLGLCTQNELDQVEGWLDESPEHVQILEQVLREIRLTKPPELNKTHIKRSVFQHIEAGNQERIRPLKPNKHNNSWAVKAVAMVSVFIIALSLTFNIESTKTAAPQPEKLPLQQRNLAYGQTSTFRFSDGSVITLNGGSSLKFPEQFEKDKREVYLEGEAYFDIAPDKYRPFLVHVGSTTTRVLGTSFNIKAYDNDKEMQIAVVEGKVGVTSNSAPSTKNPEEQIVLEKNQWATYHRSGTLVEQGEGDIWEQIAWKDQVLIFNNKPFSEVAKMLERWYGTEIIIKGKELKDAKLKGKHKSMSLEQVLQSIQFVLGIEYTIEDQVVTIQASEK